MSAPQRVNPHCLVWMWMYRWRLGLPLSADLTAMLPSVRPRPVLATNVLTVFQPFGIRRNCIMQSIMQFLVCFHRNTHGAHRPLWRKGWIEQMRGDTAFSFCETDSSGALTCQHKPELHVHPGWERPWMQQKAAAAHVLFQNHCRDTNRGRESRRERERESDWGFRKWTR